MTGDKSKLSKLNKSREGRVKFGNDDSLNINGRGSVKIGRGKLKDVLHVEGLRYNLASVSQLCNEDHKVIFTKTGCQVKSKEGNTVAAGKRIVGNLYVIDEDKTNSCLLTKVEENQLWHRRLGHLTQKNMKKL
ncbi:GAG-pre-integrase domain-containing protein, partial [Escherichia coli]|uniref:GAG-pre-integrase domain-containing protein n=1 Tax=Escherichia coli TaxID=562 RepID=UPI003F4376E0